MAISTTISILPRSNSVTKVGKKGTRGKVSTTRDDTSGPHSVSSAARHREQRQPSPRTTRHRSDTREKVTSPARVTEKCLPSILRRPEDAGIDRYIRPGDWFSLDAVLNRPASRNRCNRVWFSTSAAQIIEFPKFPIEEFSTFFYDEEELAQFKYDAWVEECGLDPADFK